MKSVKERYEKWKQRTVWQKGGDIVFWAFLILLLLPPTRKPIATAVNQLFLHVRKPSAVHTDMQQILSASDLQFGLSDSQGQLSRLQEYKGEVIFLNFWATWCPPCRAEFPGIEELYAAYGSEVRFMLVTQEDAATVQSFMNEKAYRAPVYFQQTSLPPALEVSSIPTTFIISRDGRIAGKFTGAMDWNSRSTRKMLDELLAQEVLR
ncbi:MAG: TlpA family protein disulfide reductase [Bacteroidota bacterium]